jgi:hypothetical protein
LPHRSNADDAAALDARVGGRTDQHRGHQIGCGLPSLAIVRWVFSVIGKNRDAGIDEVAKEVKEVL